MSATYHAICNHSPDVAKWGNKLDYTGIVCLIMGSYMPAMYYGFYCLPRLLEVYLALVSPLRTAAILRRSSMSRCSEHRVLRGDHFYSTTLVYENTNTCLRSGPSAWGVSPSPGSSTSARQSGDRIARSCLWAWACPVWSPSSTA